MDLLIMYAVINYVLVNIKNGFICIPYALRVEFTLYCSLKFGL